MGDSAAAQDSPLDVNPIENTRYTNDPYGNPVKFESAQGYVEERLQPSIYLGQTYWQSARRNVKIGPHHARCIREK